MGAGSVTGRPKSAGAGGDDAGFKLAPDIARDVQGIVVSGYNHLPHAWALFLTYPDLGGAWLADLRSVAPITSAAGRQTPAATIAFTYPGLLDLGLARESVSGFQPAFVEGMLEPNRRRRLGDAPRSESTPVPPAWGGKAHLRTARPAAADGPEALEVEVDAMLLLYEETPEALAGHVAAVKAVLARAGVNVVREMPLDLRLDGRGVAREHFDFSDGVSQPIPYGEGVTSPVGPCDPLHGVPLGEVLLGYTNAHHEEAAVPIVAEATDGHGGEAHQRSAERLGRMRASDKAAGLRDLGRNGSYLVVRELRQDVGAFRADMEDRAAALRERFGDETITGDWLAARIVGRTKEGHLLGPDGPLPGLQPGDRPDNAALFFAEDAFGYGCPLGSHVRRANPRDGLAGYASNCDAVLTSANAHRILRRGRKFGTDYDRDPDDPDRGLLFMCLNTDIERQFEFVQAHWMLNPNFATLLGESDPLVGPSGPMTLPHRPVRRMIDVRTYVTFRGGDYFFLPSMAALDYFETLSPPAGPGRTA